MFNDPEVAADSEQSGGTGDVLGQLASDAAGEQTARFAVLDLPFPRPSSEDCREARTHAVLSSGFSRRTQMS